MPCVCADRCIVPQLPFSSSPHKCPGCKKKIHAICGVYDKDQSIAFSNWCFSCDGERKQSSRKKKTPPQKDNKGKEKEQVGVIKEASGTTAGAPLDGEGKQQSSKRKETPIKDIENRKKQVGVLKKAAGSTTAARRGKINKLKVPRRHRRTVFFNLLLLFLWRVSKNQNRSTLNYVLVSQAWLDLGAFSLEPY